VNRRAALIDAAWLLVAALLVIGVAHVADPDRGRIAASVVAVR
jgi:hypothetical protein